MMQVGMLVCVDITSFNTILELPDTLSMPGVKIVILHEALVESIRHNYYPLLEVININDNCLGQYKLPIN